MNNKSSIKYLKIIRDLIDDNIKLSEYNTALRKRCILYKSTAAMLKNKCELSDIQMQDLHRRFVDSKKAINAYKENQKH